MRTFIAIDLPLDIKDNIYNFLEKCGFYDLKGLTFVKKENFHITVSFLGEQDLTMLLPCLDFISEKRVEYFSTSTNYSLKNIGAFPNLNTPRIFWIGINDKNRNISGFITSIEKELLKIGIISNISKYYIPHITIARNKKNLKFNFGTEIEEELGIFTIKNITLFSSKLTSNGPIYSIVKSF
ncbi:RNA 2',3'-cyclic phosphodiesterase [bacterium]|nr:RNA 2',3'-cyclic phosphodiesterase [bacterium]